MKPVKLFRNRYCAIQLRDHVYEDVRVQVVRDIQSWVVQYNFKISSNIIALLKKESDETNMA